MSLTSHELFDGDLLRIRRVVCTMRHTGISDVEDSTSDSIVLPVSGLFVKHVGPHEAVLAEPTQALLFAAGRPHRVSHPLPAGDECLVLEFAPDMLHDALTGAAGIDSLRHPLLRPCAHVSAPGLAARELLRRHLVRGSGPALAVQETAASLLAAILIAARREPVPRTARAVRASTAATRRRQVEAVRHTVLARPEAQHPLRDLARAAATTPFHLARIFRDEVGMPIHRYLLRVRLAAALPLLLDTDRDLSRIALDLGFASHSHFTASFRQATGMTPHQLRRAARANGAVRVREASRILTAAASHRSQIVGGAATGGASSRTMGDKR